jgi:hypothetical protein
VSSNGNSLFDWNSVLRRVGGGRCPHISVSPADGSVSVCYQDDDTTEIKYLRTTDAGDTCSHPVVVSGDVAAVCPNMTIDPTGAVSMVWYHRTDGIYWAYSSPDGATWSPPVRVSDVVGGVRAKPGHRAAP